MRRRCLTRWNESMPLIMVRVPKKIAKHWVLKHEKDGLDEYKISIFLKLQYELQNYELTLDNLLLFIMHFQKRGGQPMKASFWVRERKTNDIVELIRAHAEPL